MAGLDENLSPKDILPEEFKSSLPTIEEIERNMKD